MIIITVITIIVVTTIITGIISQTTDHPIRVVQGEVIIPVISRTPMSPEEQVQITHQTTITGLTGADRAL
jgi:hypothetical protein